MVPPSSATSARTICDPRPLGTKDGESALMPVPSSLTVTLSWSAASSSGVSASGVSASGVLRPGMDRSARTVISPPPAARPCSTAFWTSSVSTSDRAVASSARSRPKRPSCRTRVVPSGVAAATSTANARVARSSNATVSSRLVDKVSCTSAMAPTRRPASSSAARPGPSSSRRDCSRSRAATVCRLFFTRWWISPMMASLLISSRSRRRSSVTSRNSSSAPNRRPFSTSGMARRLSTVPLPSTSERQGALPVSTSGKPSSTWPRPRSSPVVICANEVPTSSRS